MIKNSIYDECIVNLACSIKKYFELEYNHKTLKYVDEILERNKPKNVVTILFDGMGTNVLNKTLDKNSYLLKNKLKDINSVFPPTTVAATTAFETGLTPVETGMLGWNTYFKELDKICVTYLNYEKADKNNKVIKELESLKCKYMNCKTIVESINKRNKYKAYHVSPYGDISYKNLNDMLNKISEFCNKEGKKYIYAYDEQPDNLLHKYGIDSDEVKQLIINKSKLVEKFVDNLEDTVIFIIADHGHINVDNIYLNDYPDIIECMDKNTSIESRATSFFIKQGEKEKFQELFNKYFSEYYELYSKEEIIKEKFFGDGEENVIFRDLIGDFLAVAKGNKTLLSDGDFPMISQHAGCTDEEMLVPLIVILK